MWRYVSRHLLPLIPTLLGILAITSAVIQSVFGGPVEQMIQQLTQGTVGGETVGHSTPGTLAKNGNHTSAEDLAALDVLYSLNKSPLTRSADMVWKFVRSDLGESFPYYQTVFELVKEKMPVSMSLGLWMFPLTYLICIPLGIAKTVGDDSRLDTITGMIILVGYIVPPFALGLVLPVLFDGGSFFAWLPWGGLVGDDFDMLSWAGKVKDYLWCMALPITASVIGNLVVVTVLTKNVFLGEVCRQYVYIARARGLPEKQILWEHIFHNVMIPLITGFPAAFTGAFLTEGLLIETLFSLDGLGLLSYETVMKHDYPVIMDTLYVFTLMGLLAKLVLNISYSWANPRIHFDGQK